ncbi:MAG: hypothetical protein AAGB22_02415, partial [Bacteroidota bacterium]
MPLLLTGLGIITACSGPADPGDSETPGTITINEEVSLTNTELEKATNIFVMLPSPIQTISLLQEAGADYDEAIINPAGEVSKYIDSKSQAINLGIYGADLGYATLYDQSQQSILLISSARKLADEIGISDAFNNGVISRVEANRDIQDSMVAIISDVYLVANAQMKENNQPHLAALVAAGGWIEGLYIGTQVAKRAANRQGILTHIAEQKFLLNDLFALMNLYPGSQVEEIKSDLKPLKEIYASLPVTKTEGEVTTSESGVTTIGGSRKVELSEENLTRIS